MKLSLSSRWLRWWCVALLTLTLSGWSASARALAASTVFQRVALPGVGAGERVGAITVWQGTWWVAGSFIDAAGEHRPGLWRSDDGQTWRRVTTSAITPYGEVSELYSVAASANGVVAIGAATGGAHGNPRTVSWTLGPDDVLHEVPAGFELYNGIRQISVRTIAAVPAITGPAWVIFGSRSNRNEHVGATSWTSAAAGDDFTIHDNDPALSSATGEQVLGLDVAAVGDHLVAVGERFSASTGRANTDAMAWTSTDGVAWNRWQPKGLVLGGRSDERAQRVGSNGTRIIIAGTSADQRGTSLLAWVSADGRAWQRRVINALGRSDNALSSTTVALATDDQWLIGGRIGDRLRLAVSEDGRHWDPLQLPSDLPTGTRAVLSAASNNTALFIGARSLDGGGLWRITKTR